MLGVGAIFFFNRSSAGSSTTIINSSGHFGAATSFFDFSTAGDATIINEGSPPLGGATVIDALRNRKVLAFFYKGQPRIVEAQSHGLRKITQRPVMHGYQRAGASVSGYIRGVRLFELAKISEFRQTGERLVRRALTTIRTIALCPKSSLVCRALVMNRDTITGAPTRVLPSINSVVSRSCRWRYFWLGIIDVC